MKLQLLRNATQILAANGKNILIDPMFAAKDTFDPLPAAPGTPRAPLVDLPINEDELLSLIKEIDAVLLTHIHFDHWDKKAQELLPKDITLFCQPANTETIRGLGFTNVIPVNDQITWNEISINRTGGRHGTGEVGERMGIVSGYYIKHQNDAVYIAGDTIWCDEVMQAIDQFKPDRIVVNGGAARFAVGDPIVMNIEDVIKVCRYAPFAKIYVVHLEAVSHGTESREQIKITLQTNGLTQQCFIPNDGEFLF
jgi:L-ascorbate metabolism protein UlaG (beta-lactamase superfamily)